MLLILGFYLLLIHPILLYLVLVVFNVRLAIPWTYFIFWIDALRALWWWIAILFAGLGLVLIKYGRRYMLNINNISLKSVEVQ